MVMRQLEEGAHARTNKAMLEFNRYNLEELAVHTTIKNDKRTNIIDQGCCKPYALSPFKVQELFDKLDRVRRAGGVAHFSERQSFEGHLCCGIMIDFDIKTPIEDARLNPRDYARLATALVKQLYEDLETGDTFSTHVFFI